MKLRIAYLTPLLLAFALYRASAEPSPPPTTQAAKAETWVTKPFAQWPQIHLTHEILLKDNRSMSGASAFLVKLEDGRIIAATARHLLADAGGFDPPVPLDKVDDSIALWLLHPRTLPHNTIRLDKLITKISEDGIHDSVAMTVKGDAHYLPAVPLKPRTENLTKGERIYLVGVPYSEPHSRQNVYPGVVDRGQNHDEVECILDGDGVVTQGFSGAPVVDADGHMAGILLGHYDKAADGKSKHIAILPTNIFLQTLMPK